MAPVGSAGAVVVDVEADAGVLLATGAAAAAGDVEGDGDEVADVEVFDVGAFLDDLAGDLVAEDEKRSERDALDRLEGAIGSGGRGAGGAYDTLAALNERRVQTLLLEPALDRRGARCPSCGLLVLDPSDPCPADGSETEEIEHLREAAVEAALAQGAEVMVIRHYPDLGPLQGIVAILRF